MFVNIGCHRNLILSYHHLQVLLVALVKAVDKARERHYNDPSYWPDVIEAVNDLVPEKDMKKFKEYCSWGEHGLGEYADDNVNNLMMGLNAGKDEEGDDDSDNMHAVLFEETQAYQDARDGYLTREVWKGYREWLSNCPSELEQFKEFMVSKWYAIFSSIVLLITNFIPCASYVIPILVLIREGLKFIVTR